MKLIETFELIRKVLKGTEHKGEISPNRKCPQFGKTYRAIVLEQPAAIFLVSDDGEVWDQFGTLNRWRKRPS